MRYVVILSALLIAGIVGSQFLPMLPPGPGELVSDTAHGISMICLAFIMIRVGMEFQLDKSGSRQYVKDYLVAATAAGIPWVLCAAYFIVLIGANGEDGNIWREASLSARFAAPTSAGILFTMLAAAGLRRTWLFRKARILAIFDDLDTILFMIPLTILLAGFQWEVFISATVMVLLLVLAWHYLHTLYLPVQWPWILSYSIVLSAISEGIRIFSTHNGLEETIHIEILLPAFVLGCMIRHPERPLSPPDSHHVDLRFPAIPEASAGSIIAGLFMLSVGLSMPSMSSLGMASFEAGHSMGMLAAHVLAITFLMNLGKMVPLFCYRREANLKARLALSIGMWPRGEVGAGVIVIAMGLGIGGTMIFIATLALALNLALTGFFILMIRRLLTIKVPVE